MREDLLPTTKEGKLARVLEECGEVVKAHAKLLRFGAFAIDPKTLIAYDNVTDLNKEIEDLRHAIAEYQNATKTS